MITIDVGSWKGGGAGWMVDMKMTEVGSTDRGKMWKEKEKKEEEKQRSKKGQKA